MTENAAQTQARSRYPGTRPFGDSPEDVAKFFGRSSETEDLYLRVLSTPLLVQFGKSGLGKTSLLQAGLFPRLRKKPYLPVMVRLNVAAESLTDAVQRAIAESCAAEKLVHTPEPAAGLWELLGDLTVWRGDVLLTPVLVFDQFEEVFTLRDAAFRGELSAELGALATGIAPARVPAGTPKPDLKLIISLREDYLGSLEEFASVIPGLFHERLRLEALSDRSARTAITEPALLKGDYDSPPFDFEKAALDAMVAYLKGTSGVIEPFQLQLLSRHAEKIATRKAGPQKEKVTLTYADFHEGRDFASVLDRFYRDTLDRISPRSQQSKAEVLCEEGLLGAGGHRLMLEQRQILGDYGISQQTLDTLANERLIRREARQESVFYEISHDRLAESIRNARSTKLPRKLKRALWAAASIGLVLVAILGYYNFRVQKERNNAEELLSFLLGEEFLGEVRDSGRTSLLALVSDRVNAEEGTRWDVNHGLALRNRGDIAMNGGKLQPAIVDFRGALELFDVDDDAEPMVVREAARTRERLAEALLAQGRLQEALGEVNQAIAARRRVIAQPEAGSTPTLKDCTSLANDLVAAADLHHRMGDMPRTMTQLDAAYAIVFNLLFIPYGPECAKVVQPLQPYPHADVLDSLARQVMLRAIVFNFREEYTAAGRLSEQARQLEPTSTLLRRFSLGARDYQAWAISLPTNPQAALNEFRGTMREYDEMLRWDPLNRTWRRDAAVTRLLIVMAMAECHRQGTCTSVPPIEEVDAVSLEVVAAFRELQGVDPTDAVSERDLLSSLEQRALLLAMRGRHDEALRVMQELAARQEKSTTFHDPRDGDRVSSRSRWLRVEAEILAALNRLPEARATLARAADLLKGAEPSGKPSAVTDLRAIRGAEAVIFRQAGDAAAADAAHAESIRLQALYLTLISTREAKANEQSQLSADHVNRGAKLLEAENTAGAMGEFQAGLPLLRQELFVRPALVSSYDALRNLYDWIQWSLSTDAKKGAERSAALRAAMNAAQLAAWLAPKEEQRNMSATLLRIGNTFTTFLFHERSATPEVLTMAQEVVAVAERMVIEQPEPAVIADLGNAKCGLGMARRQLGLVGWEEVTRSGLINIDRASAGATVEQLREFAVCRHFLAVQLEERGDAAQARELYTGALHHYEAASAAESRDPAVEEAIKDLRAKLGVASAGAPVAVPGSVRPP